MKNFKFSLPILFCVLVITFSCTKENSDSSNHIYSSGQFNYETTISTTITIKAHRYQAGGIFKVYTADLEKGGKLLFEGRLDENGQYESAIALPTALESVYFVSFHIGLPGDIEIPVERGSIFYDFTNIPKYSSKKAGVAPKAKTNNGITYNYMGSYNSQGVPNYLENPGDVLSADFLDAVNASLPERQPVPTYNAHYLASGNSTDLVITDSADVWITFVHEGAGYRNSLGYYVYSTNNPPTSASDIDTIHYIFPNVSFSGSGGGLTSGNKVSLGSFGAGKSIGWAIGQNSWDGSSVNTANRHFYSNPDFNPESNASLRQHNVQLYDNARDLILIGFEDLKRDAGSDEDFNDAIFYVSANPITSIQTGTLPPVITSGTDSDGDGVPDTQDEYPSDPNQAFNNYSPYANGFSSIAFEDLWPAEGDYDFNDLVIKANYNCITNGVNALTKIEMELMVDHIGASFHNGFGIELPVSPSNIASVSGYNITQNLVNLGSNGLESGQSKAVIIVFDDAFDNQGQTLNITVTFSTPVNKSSFSQSGVNPFIFINGERGKEVHLPNKTPTDKMNTNYFGQGADVSDPANGIYYKTVTNEPWAINISHDYKAPVEKVNIKNAYLRFSNWVNSNGDLYKDWYENNNGYRNSANLQ